MNIPVVLQDSESYKNQSRIDFYLKDSGVSIVCVQALYIGQMDIGLVLTEALISYSDWNSIDYYPEIVAFLASDDEIIFGNAEEVSTNDYDKFVSLSGYFENEEGIGIFFTNNKNSFSNTSKIVNASIIIFLLFLFAVIIFLNWKLTQTVDELGTAERNKLYRSMFDNNSSTMLLIDPETGRIIGANKAAEKFYGYSSDEFKQMNISNINQLSEVEINALMELAATNKKNYFEFIHKVASGANKHVEVYSGRIDYKGKKILHTIVHDITEKYEAERVKELFLANMSHELRTPLNGIMGMLNIIKYQNVDDKSVQYIDMATQSAENLLRIVEDILNLSQISNTNLNIKASEFDIVSTIDKIVKINTSSAEQKGLRIEFKSNRRQIRVTSDQTRISQIVINLISNAIKFSERGIIKVEIYIDEDLIVKVIDSGIGIPEDKQQDIFQQFFQLENPYTKTHGGIGAGLAITKQLCEMLGGSISVKSIPGEGSEFTLVLPGSIIAQ